MTFFNRQYYIALTGFIVNISATGCLFSNEKTPWSTMNVEQTEEALFDLIDEPCHVYVPWANVHRTGKIRRVRSFIIGVEFDEKFKENTVNLISRLEPNEHRHFKPDNSRKYDRILRLGQDQN